MVPLQQRLVTTFSRQAGGRDVSRPFRYSTDAAET
jgi:hypothetical protein